MPDLQYCLHCCLERSRCTCEDATKGQPVENYLFCLPAGASLDGKYRIGRVLGAGGFSILITAVISATLLGGAFIGCGNDHGSSAENHQVAKTESSPVIGENTAKQEGVLKASNSGWDGRGIRAIGDRGLDAELAMGLDAFGGTMGAGGGGFAGTGVWGGGDFGPSDLRGIAGLINTEAEDAATRVKFKGAGAARVVTGPISLDGELDRQTVQRYIQSKLDQIRYCYQSEVQRNPNLAGQKRAEWVILPTGKVASVKIGQTTLNSPAVEKCVVARIRSWRFPSPKGGGTARVSYPFTFKFSK
ncbi:MAG TPA: AgmX/PglI C-terminal domain-containing protein [Myxococcota bacterium]|nr:AgmX/PglI C-terminal domain-containing protein [Myxococcota bacterium]